MKQRRKLFQSGQFSETVLHWRQLARQASLSRCLEEVLTETHYADWLLSQPRGAQRHANVEQFLGLAQKFDQFQQQGLFRFLKFIEAQSEAGAEPEVAPVAGENAVRLMSIHQSKGLEFPVVAVANLAKPFNTQDLRDEIIFDEEFGLCPHVKPPQTGRRYPSLPHWLAQQRQRREQWGEELRLLYVAMTRARDTLILTGTVTEKKWETLWTEPAPSRHRPSSRQKVTPTGWRFWFRVQVHRRKCGRESKVWRKVNCRICAGELRMTRNLARSTRGAEMTRPNSGKRKGKRLRDSPTETHRLDAHGGKTRTMLTWEYPFAAATQRAAKSSVTALRRQAEELDDEAEPIFRFQFSAKQSRGLSPHAIEIRN